MNILEFQKKYEPHHAIFVREMIRDFQGNLGGKISLQYLKHYEKLCLSAGKRSRPFLFSLGLSYSTKSASEAGWRLSFVFEIFHIFCLIHDDIMDGGQYRHDVETLGFFTPKLPKSSLKKKKIVDNTKNSFAILFGDLAFAFALRNLSVALGSFEGRKAGQAFDVFFRMVREVVGGQMLDIEMLETARPKINLIKKKTILKTSSYTFSRPLQIGMILSDAPSTAIELADRFGHYLGLAFQIEDDLADLFCSRSVTGKTSGGDFFEGQETLISGYFWERADRLQIREMEKIFGKGRSPEALRRGRELFWESGAVDYALKQADLAYKKSLLAARVIPKIGTSLVELLEYVRQKGTVARRAARRS